MKVAVTGASGFVGRHVLRVLARTEGVDGVVATSTGEAGEWLPAGMQHVRLDVAAPGPDFFARLGRPDVVMHLAWKDVRNYLTLDHFETQLGQHYKFLRSLISDGLPALLCAGTCFEYGMQSGELPESLVTNPSNSYGFAKDALRRKLEFLKAQCGFQLTWARLFYSYGEGQTAGSLYGQFLAAVADQSPIFRMSGGEQLRDYLPIHDVAQLLVDLACAAPDAGVVNVCAGKPTSVRDLVAGWRDSACSPIALGLGHYPYAAHEPMEFWGSNAKLTRLLER